MEYVVLGAKLRSIKQRKQRLRIQIDSRNDAKPTCSNPTCGHQQQLDQLQKTVADLQATIARTRPPTRAVNPNNLVLINSDVETDSN